MNKKGSLLMKYIIGLLLSITLVYLCPMITYSAISDEYVVVPVEYSDNVGRTEGLELFVQNSTVYVNAENLANRFGYQLQKNNQCVTIYNQDNKDLPIGITQFYYDNTRVKHMLFSRMIDTYEAPAPSIENDKGIWIPLEYSLLMLNSGMLILDDCILIDIPDKNIMDYFYEALINVNDFRFEWYKTCSPYVKDYSAGKSKRMLEMINRALNVDGDSWAALFQAFAMETSVYDKKYAENKSFFLCNESYDELTVLGENAGSYREMFLRGRMLDILEQYSADSEFKTEFLYGNIEQVLDDIKANNSSAVIYNKSYRALQDVLDGQTWLSDVSANIIETQRELYDFGSMADIVWRIVEATQYRRELENEIDFPFSAMKYYLDTSIGQGEALEAIKQSMENRMDTLSGIKEYSFIPFFDENVNEWVDNNFKTGDTLRANVCPALFEDMASHIESLTPNYISEDDQLYTLYLQVFQADAFMNYQKFYGRILNHSNSFRLEELYDLSQYCYIYLKSCYLTRFFALTTMIDISDDFVQNQGYLIDREKEINHDIAKAMAALKKANKTNERNVYGFLPSDNKSYLSVYDNNNSKLTAWVENMKNASSILEVIPKSYIFASGAGAWGTRLYINEDGSFTAQYHDTNQGDTGEGYPNGSVCICDFYGHFSKPEQIDEFIYSMKLENLEIEGENGEIYYKDGVRYIYSEPYGFDNADEILIYTPGIRMSELPSEFVYSVSTFIDTYTMEVFPYYGIYNVSGERGFIDYF